jgi:hypothetical protein
MFLVNNDLAEFSLNMESITVQERAVCAEQQIEADSQWQKMKTKTGS